MSSPKVLRNTLYASVGIYTEFVLGMLASILIARRLGPHDFGGYSVVIWLVSVGVAVTNSGTASAAIKFIAELRGSARDEQIAPLVSWLRRAQRVFLGAVVLAGGLAFWLAGDHFAPGLDHLLLFAVMAVGVLLRAPYMFNIGVAKGFENFRATASVALLATPVNLLLVFGAWLLHAPLEGFLAVYAISSLVFWWLARRQALAMVSPAPATALPPELVARVRHHMLVSAFTVTVTYVTASDVEVLLLTALSAPADAGLFKVAHLLASGAASLVPGVFSVVLLPMMANALSQGQGVATQRFVGSTNYLALLAAPLVAFGVVFAAPVIALLYGPAYAGAALPLAVLVCAHGLAALSASSSSLLISADRQASVLALVASCGALKIGLDVVLIMHYGLLGAVVASAIAALVTALAMFALAIRTLGRAPDWSRIARIALAAALAAAIASPLLRIGSPLWSVLGAFAAAALAYPLLTLLLRCWSDSDIAHVQTLHRRVAAGRPRVLAALLHWAGARAPREVT